MTFKRRDIISDDYNDRIAIDKMQMECLHSGVIVYDYDYSKWNADFSATDEKYNKVKTVVTDVYWRNVLNADNPCNVVNYQTIEHIYDLIEAERLDREQEFYDLKKYVSKDFTEKLDKEIERSNAVDIEFHKIINNNHTECVNTSTEINNKLDAEIKRSTETDIELFNLINSNKSDSVNKTTDLEAKLDAEIARSKQADSDHTNADNTLSLKLDNEVERAKTAEGAIRDAVENERDRAIAKETLISDTLTSKLDNEIERAKDREEHINDDLHAEITRAKAEEKRIEDLITSNTNKDSDLSDKLTAEINRAKQAEKDLNDIVSNEITRSKNKDTELSGLIDDLTTSIADEVKRSTDTDKAITDALNDVQNDLTKEVARAKAEEGRIEAKVNTNTSSISSEISRAKAVEADITSSLQALKTSVNTKNSENADAIADLQTKTKSNADAIAVINGDSDVIGSIQHSLYHANHYTDEKIDELEETIDSKTSFVLQSYATKIEVDNRIKGVIGTAPEALDTLGEIATVLNGNGDAITAINGVLAGKANSSDVYTKTETDNRIKNVSDALTAEVSRATTKENDLNSAISSEIARSTAADNKLTTDLSTEVSRAKAAEKANADAIAVLNGGEEVIGSVAHGVADAKHYTDDEIAKLQANQNVALSNMATKNEVSTIDGKLTAHISESTSKFGNVYTKSEVDNLINDVDLTDYYTKSEVDDIVADIDVTDQLTAYAKKSRNNLYQG